MKKINLMTVTFGIAAAVLSQIRVADAFRPAGPGLRERLYSSAGKMFRRLRWMLDNWVAEQIARRERQAAMSAPRCLSDTEPRNFGGYRGRPRSAFHRHRDVKLVTRRGRK